MRIQILGGHGGLAPGFSTTSFLINGELLIDAGAVASVLSIEEQAKIDHILISHSHLDHIKDLAFICDNCFGMREKPFEVHTHATVKKLLKDHLFNETIWPDFTIIPSAQKPTIKINAIEPEKTVQLMQYKITPVLVQHPNHAMGFIVEDKNSAVIFTVDTGATDRIWEIARGMKNIKAIFTEVSFPDSLQNVATASDHHTPKTLQAELQKMPVGVPVILTHLKPNFRDVIFKEIADLGESRIQILENDGTEFNF